MLNRSEQKRQAVQLDSQIERSLSRHMLDQTRRRPSESVATLALIRTNGKSVARSCLPDLLIGQVWQANRNIEALW